MSDRRPPNDYERPGRRPSLSPSWAVFLCSRPLRHACQSLRMLLVDLRGCGGLTGSPSAVGQARKPADRASLWRSSTNHLECCGVATAHPQYSEKPCPCPWVGFFRHHGHPGAVAHLSAHLLHQIKLDRLLGLAVFGSACAVTLRSPAVVATALLSLPCANQRTK